MAANYFLISDFGAFRRSADFFERGDAAKHLVDAVPVRAFSCPQLMAAVESVSVGAALKVSSRIFGDISISSKMPKPPTEAGSLAVSAAGALCRIGVCSHLWGNAGSLHQSRRWACTDACISGKRREPTAGP